MSSAESLLPRTSTATRRFAVAWRNRRRRLITPVAVLDHRPAGYRFQYLRGVDKSVEGFRPFIGFPDVQHIYESARLWPFFDLRVMDPKRSDFSQYVRWLGLTPAASRLDILSRSGGEQKGDSVYLAEAPIVGDDGATKSVFLARGASYAAGSLAPRPPQTHFAPATTSRLSTTPATRLIRRPCSSRRHAGHPSVGTRSPDRLRPTRPSRGWQRAVAADNGRLAPWHARLLVRISGRITPGTAMFTGGVWPSA